MRFRQCKKSDIENVVRLLKQEGLPTDDIADHINNIFIAEDDSGCFIGMGAIEVYGETGLFRSLVVDKAKRNDGRGAVILTHIENEATQRGIKQLYLLTESAGEYFERHGFNVVNREAVPDEIKHTRQFSSLCPASAKVMKKTL